MIKATLLIVSFFCLVSNADVAPGPGAGRGNASLLQGVAVSATAPTSAQVLTYNATTAKWEPAAAGGAISLSAIGASANANGMTLTGSALNLEPASASFGGVVTTGVQTIAGAKTWSGAAAYSSDITMTAGSFTVTPSADGNIGVTVNAKGSGNGATVDLDATVNSAGGKKIRFFASGSGNGDIAGNKFAVKDLGGSGLSSYAMVLDMANNRAGFGGVVPTSTLHVSGTVNITGDATMSGKIIGDGGDTFVGFLQKQVASTTVGITAAQCGSTFVNDSADVMTLPEASTVLGCRLTFVCATAANFDVNPADGTDQISVVNFVSTIAGVITPAAGDAIRCADIGSSIVLEAVGANLWVAIGVANGTWADVN